MLVAACGRSARTPELTPMVADGGCTSDCEAGGNSAAGGATDTVAGGGTSIVGGTFSLAGTPTFGPGPAPVVQVECVPASVLCADGDLYTCDSSGTLATLTQDCGKGAHCQTLYPGDCLCMDDVCEPGARACDGNLLKTCSDDGTMPQAGTDCANLACDGGTCQPKICEPRTSFVCRDGDVHLCLGQGATSKLARSCGAGTTCRGEPPTLDCLPLPCLPESMACVDNKVGKCAKDGNSLSSIGQDCADKGDVCDSAGTCSSLAVDDLGGAAEAAAASYIGNFIDVHSSRHITKLEVNVRPVVGDVMVHWEIFRIVNRVAVEQLVMADSIAHVGDTTASTTALSCDLGAGQRYELVAFFDPPANVDFAMLQAPQVVSFGAVSWVADDNMQRVYAMRVTTTLP
jgi:hypothetical protein